MAYYSSLLGFYYILFFFVATCFALYVIFTAPAGYFSPGDFLETTSPYGWALTGVALNIGSL